MTDAEKLEKCDYCGHSNWWHSVACAVKRGEYPDLGSVPLDRLELTVRSYNGLRNRGVDTVADILRWFGSESELRKIKNIGKLSAKEITGLLTDIGAINTCSRCDDRWSAAGSSLCHGCLRTMAGMVLCDVKSWLDFDPEGKASWFLREIADWASAAARGDLTRHPDPPLGPLSPAPGPSAVKGDSGV